MDLVKWEPFDGLSRVQSRINELFDDTFGRAQRFSSEQSGVWYPPVDILESRDAYLIRAELAGMKKDDVNVEFKDGFLTLTGERKFDEPAAGVEYHRVERNAGKFTRSFHLPESIKQDEIKATYRDGILEVHVPKSEDAKPRQIAITIN